MKLSQIKRGVFFAGHVVVMLLGLFLVNDIEAKVNTESTSPEVQVRYPTNHDRTKGPLQDIQSAVVQDLGGNIVPLYSLPHRERVDKPVLPPVLLPHALPQKRMVSEPAVPMPPPLLSFEGTSNVNGVAPPDTCGDVGANHYVQAVNLSYQVFDKAGNSIHGPAPVNTLWAGFGGICETRNNGDPIVLYDQWADRWLISQFALDYGGAGFHQCIAVSKTGDPTGEWNRYDYKMSDTIMNDYPKFGIWPDGYYMSINQFNAASGYSWAGQGVAVFDRTAMLDGDIAAMQYFDLHTVYPDLSAMLPSDADGMFQPAPSDPNHFVMFTDDNWGGDFSDQLVMYNFHVDWVNPANTSFLPGAALDTDPFTWFPGSIDQPDTTVKVASLGDRLMYRLQYRNFGSHESMVVNHTVDSGLGIAGVRWYELRNEGTGWALHQQGTHAPDASHRWMGSLAMDQQGNIAAGYSVSNSTDVYPSIRYAGRLGGDPPGTFAQAETELHRGSGSQTESTYRRWGDYSMMSVDPVDDCTFWYTQEYMETTGPWGWQTRIGAFKFPSCTNGPVGSLSGRVEDTTGTPVADVLIKIDDGGGRFWSTVTDADGYYFFAAVPDISPATYSVTAGKYAYGQQVVTGVALSTEINTVVDFIFDPLPVHTLSGVVNDTVTSWPLYAQVDYGVGSVWTDPLTGVYSIDLPEGDLDLTVTGYVTGYDPAARSITLNTDATEDFSLVVDPAICDAQGYGFSAPLVQEFTRCIVPAGWTVKNNGGDCDWRPDNPGFLSNLTGGTGCFAVADSDACDYMSVMNTELISPSFDATALSSLELEFKYDVYVVADTIKIEVDVSNDGGNTWVNVWHRNAVNDRGPQTAVVDISGLADGYQDVKIRFHYTAPSWDWWWQLDDVYVYQRPKNNADLTTCIAPAGGGLVLGNVYDDNTGISLDDAMVSDGAGHSAISVSTPGDDSIDDGFFSLYVSGSGLMDLSASLDKPRGYGADLHTVLIPAFGTVKQDFFLPAGYLMATPDSVEIFIRSDGIERRNLLLDNLGGAGGSFKFIEVDASIPVLANGPFAVQTRHMSPKHLEDSDSVYSRYDYPGLVSIPVVNAPGDLVNTWPSGLVFPWGTGFDKTDDTVWLGNLAVNGGDDVNYEFTPTGSPTGQTLDVSSIQQVFMADMAYDLARNTLWQINVGGGDCIHELDQTGLTVTGEKICPIFASSQRGLAYNVKTDTFYAGSWNDSTIYEFNRDGIVLRSVDVGLPVSGLAFNPVTDHLFAMNNTNLSFQIAVLDVLNNFSALSAFGIPGFSLNGGAGLAMDNQGRLWTADKNTGTVFQVDSGELTGSLDITWLTVTPANGIVLSNVAQEITLDFDATGLKAGKSMNGNLILHDDTPYGAQFISVIMHVVDLPVITSSSFSDVKKESVKVISHVDPQCLSTEYYFEYGTEDGVYDKRTASVFSSSCSPVVLEFLLSGLVKDTTYYGRFIAVNDRGTTVGKPVLFTTDPFPWLLFRPISAKAAKIENEKIAVRESKVYFSSQSLFFYRSFCHG